MTIRDLDIINFLEDYKVATTGMLTHLFFNDKIPYAYKRLNWLYKHNHINRLRLTQESINSEYVYYVNKPPKQIKHQLGIVWFIIKWMDNYDIINIQTECNIGNIRPDAIIEYTENNEYRVLCLEVELSKNGFNYMKYEQFFSNSQYRNYFKTVPKIVLIGNGNIPSKSRLRYEKYQINEMYKV